MRQSCLRAPEQEIMANAVSAKVNDERLGDCPHCGASNSYLNIHCEQCEKRLPWGVAVARRERKLAAVQEAPVRKKLFMPAWVMLLVAFGLPPFGIAMLLFLFNRNRVLGLLCANLSAVGYIFLFIIMPIYFPSFC